MAWQGMVRNVVHRVWQLIYGWMPPMYFAIQLHQPLAFNQGRSTSNIKERTLG